MASRKTRLCRGELTMSMWSIAHVQATTTSALVVAKSGYRGSTSCMNSPQERPGSGRCVRNARRASPSTADSRARRERDPL
jgi:hypothetical protein